MLQFFRQDMDIHRQTAAHWKVALVVVIVVVVVSPLVAEKAGPSGHSGGKRASKAGGVCLSVRNGA